MHLETQARSPLHSFLSTSQKRKLFFSTVFCFKLAYLGFVHCVSKSGAVSDRHAPFSMEGPPPARPVFLCPSAPSLAVSLALSSSWGGEGSNTHAVCWGRRTRLPLRLGCVWRGLPATRRPSLAAQGDQQQIRGVWPPEAQPLVRGCPLAARRRRGDVPRHAASHSLSHRSSAGLRHLVKSRAPAVEYLEFHVTAVGLNGSECPFAVPPAVGH